MVTDEREALRRQLAAEIDSVVARLQVLRPDFEPPPFSLNALADKVRRGLEQSPELTTVRETFQGASREDLLDREIWQGLGYMLSYSAQFQANNLKERLVDRLPAGWQAQLNQVAGEDLLDEATWRGLWYVLTYSARFQAEQLKERLAGDYETDEWGLDREFLAAVQPVFTFLYQRYWRVAVTGVANVPATGPALLVGNRAARRPFEAAMVATALELERAQERPLRSLYDASLASVPFLTAVLTKLGQAPATVENGIRLLAQDELVAVYPSAGDYRLESFDRSGYIKLALRSGAPIIPLAVVGVEEAYLALRQSPALARLEGLPSSPLSRRLARLAPLAALPYPTKWSIDFGTPITLDNYGPEAADNLALVLQLSEQVQTAVASLYN